MDTSGPFPILETSDGVDQTVAYSQAMATALAGTWTLLPMTNGWAPFGGPVYNPPQYRRNGDTIEFDGLAKGPLGAVMATLPAGFRPTGTVMLAAVGALGGTKGLYAVDVKADGSMSSSGSGTTNYISLSGLQFSISTRPPSA